MARRILVVEDEAPIREMVCFVLEQNGFQPVEAEDYDSAVNQLNEPWPDLILLDWMLPGGSGLQFIKLLKREAMTRDIPVVMLTARGEEEDRVRGLETGADDYITKPFAMAELLARIRAIHRRDALGTPDRVASGTVDLDLFHHHVKVNGAELPLSRTEFDVLRSLVMAEEAVVPRSQLLKEIWGTESYINPNVLDQYVSYLRRKLLSAHADRQIETVRGIGYRLVPKGQ